MIEALRKIQTNDMMFRPPKPPLEVLALAGREFLQNLTRLLTGDFDEETGAPELPYFPTLEHLLKNLSSTTPESIEEVDEMPTTIMLPTLPHTTTEEIPDTTYAESFHPHRFFFRRPPLIGRRTRPTATWKTITTTETPTTTVDEEEEEETWTFFPTEQPTTTETQPPVEERVRTVLKFKKLTKNLTRTSTNSPRRAITTPKSTTSTESASSCEVCKPGQACEVRLRSFETSDQVFQYAYSHATMIDDSLQSLLRETQGAILPPPLTWKALVPPESVQFAQNMVSLLRPSRCLIIGVFTGLSLLGLASRLDPRAIVVALEYPEFAQYWQKIGLKHALKLQQLSRIQMRASEDVDRALQRLATNEPNTFDFIFLDDHRKENYLDDYEHSIRLLRTGGLLIINGALNGGSVLSSPEFISQSGKVVRNMNVRIKQDARVTATLLPFAEGTWVISKN